MSIRNGKEKMKKTSLIILAFILVFTLVSCGSGEDTVYDQTTAEGLARLVFQEMVDAPILYEDYRTPPFDCASPLYLGETNILKYYSESALGSAGTIGVCQQLKEDAKSSMYTRLENSDLKVSYFEADDEGFIQNTMTKDSLPFVEGTLYLSDGSSVHFSRIVQHNGLWYIIVLRNYPQAY